MSRLDSKELAKRPRTDPCRVAWMLERLLCEIDMIRLGLEKADYNDVSLGVQRHVDSWRKAEAGLTRQECFDLIKEASPDLFYEEPNE